MANIKTQIERQRKTMIMQNQIIAQKKAGKEINKKEFILHYCGKWGISRRTITEYFDIAMESIK